MQITCVTSEADHYETQSKPTSFMCISSEILGALLRNQRKGLSTETTELGVIYHFCFNVSAMLLGTCKQVQLKW